MSDSVLSDMLPEGIRAWLPAELRRPKAAERYTTCSDCAMLVPGCDPDAGDPVFRADTKCCTYHPWLPNFLVGGLLGDSEGGLDEGRRRVEGKIAERVGVLPVGIQAPRLETHLYRIGRNVFGRAQALRCPYYGEEIGGCTVWKYREAVCATWFCKYVEGEDGFQLWRAVRTFLEELEEALVIHVLLELGFPGERVRAWLRPGAGLDSSDYDHRAPTPREYRRIWGDWEGREAELYRRAWELASEVDGDRATALTGARGRARLDAVRRLADEIDAGRPPEVLRLNPKLGYAPGEASGVVLTTYSPYDPARLSRRLFEVLHVFDGRRSNAEALATAEREHGLRLSPRLVLKLHQQRILVEP